MRQCPPGPGVKRHTVETGAAHQGGPGNATPLCPREQRPQRLRTGCPRFMNKCKTRLNFFSFRLGKVEGMRGQESTTQSPHLGSPHPTCPRVPLSLSLSIMPQFSSPFKEKSTHLLNKRIRCLFASPTTGAHSEPPRSGYRTGAHAHRRSQPHPKADDVSTSDKKGKNAATQVPQVPSVCPQPFVSFPPNRLLSTKITALVSI